MKADMFVDNTLKQQILTGIVEGLGRPEDMNFVRPDWFKDIGHRAAKVGNARRKTKFFSKETPPAGNISEALKEGHYTSYNTAIETRELKVFNASQEKLVHLVVVLESKSIEEYLQKRGMRICENSSAYFLGMMPTVPQRMLPEEFCAIDIIAFEANNPNSIFSDRNSSACFLSMRQDNQGRLLGLRHVNQRLPDKFALLAQDI